MKLTMFTAATVVSLYSTASAGPVAIYAAKPQYTQFAADHHIEGDGLFIMRVQIRTGLVKDVQVPAVPDGPVSTPLQYVLSRNGASNRGLALQLKSNSLGEKMLSLQRIPW
jgi:hypothetical protein